LLVSISAVQLCCVRGDRVARWKHALPTCHYAWSAWRPASARIISAVGSSLLGHWLSLAAALLPHSMCERTSLQRRRLRGQPGSDDGFGLSASESSFSDGALAREFGAPAKVGVLRSRFAGA
jgi:hypothetical protein